MLILLLLLLLTIPAGADTPTERELQRQLDTALAKIAAQSSTQTQRTQAADLAAQNVASASDLAAVNVAKVAQTAQANAALAATAAAVTLSSQQAAERSNMALLITQVSGFMAVLAGFLYKSFTEGRDRRWSLEDARIARAELHEHQTTVLRNLDEVKGEAHAANVAVGETRATIEVLEKNTNSIKDALVKATADISFAAGLKRGKESKSPTAEAPDTDRVWPTEKQYEEPEEHSG
jgi:multidrug efflux pump subunit AcrA (membrane-fusion protein)